MILLLWQEQLVEHISHLVPAAEWGCDAVPGRRSWWEAELLEITLLSCEVLFLSKIKAQPSRKCYPLLSLITCSRGKLPCQFA